MFNRNEVISLRHSNYTIIEALNSGSQGTVWRVLGQNQESYALKVVNVRDSRDLQAPLYPPKDIKTLIDYANAEITFLLDLPDAVQHYIAPCVDHGVIIYENYRLPAFVMPLYVGNLSHYLNQQRYQNQTISFAQWQRWFKQLLTALHYMQSVHKGDKRPVHRDLKPSNLLLDDAQNLFLTDFGIVRESNEVGTTSLVFSYFYCAPEQRLANYVTDDGDAHFYITPALDVYAAGIILHEILAGQTQSQKELNDDRKKLQHERTLHRLDHKPKGKVGLLGKIGGLTEHEYDYLHKLISAAMGADSDTLIVQYTGLPHNGKISQAYSQLIQAMLAPWPDDRSSIASVLQTLTRLEYAQHPQLERFELDNVPLSATMGQKLTVFLVIHGKGLPQTLDWLVLELNQQPLKNVSFHLLDEQHNNHYYQRRYQLIFPEFNHEKAAVLRIWTRIHGKQRQIQQTINVLPNAEHLWRQGKRLEALQLEPRVAWLDDWEQSAQTISEKYELLMALQTLQAQYPQNEALVQRYQNINSTNHKPTRPKKTLPWRTALLASAVFAGGVFVVVSTGWGNLVPYQSIPPPVLDNTTHDLIKQLEQTALSLITPEVLAGKPAAIKPLALRQAWLFGLSKPPNGIEA
jgi:serine/threonine protein kinase